MLATSSDIGSPILSLLAMPGENTRHVSTDSTNLQRWRSFHTPEAKNIISIDERTSKESSSMA